MAEGTSLLAVFILSAAPKRQQGKSEIRLSLSYNSIVGVARLMLTKHFEKPKFIRHTHMWVLSKYIRATHSIKSYDPVKNEHSSHKSSYFILGNSRKGFLPSTEIHFYFTAIICILQVMKLEDM